MSKGPKTSSPPKTESSKASSCDMIVVGGGLVGGCLALAMAKGGVSVTIVDRTPLSVLADAPYDGRSSAIAYSSKQMLDQIGLWATAEAAAQPILDIRVSDGAAPLYLHYDHLDVADQTGGAPFGWIVENAALRRGLAELLQADANIQVLAPATALHLEGNGAATTVHLSDGGVLKAPLVVAADGTESSLRKLMRIPVTQWRYPQVGIVCTMGHEQPHDGIAHERFLPAGPFAVLPMTDDGEGRHRSSIVWTEKEKLTPTMMRLSDADFSAEMQRRFGDWYGKVELLGDRWQYPLRLLHADRYVAPRFALVGDAAHTIHPIAGQGLNLGLRDVAALAEVVIDDRRLGLDPGSLATLRRYEQWRRPDNVALMAVTDGLNRLFSNDIGPLRLVRDLGMAAVNRMPQLKRTFMQHAMGTVGNLPRLLRGEAL